MARTFGFVIQALRHENDFFGYFVVDVKVDYVCYQQVKNCGGVVTKRVENISATNTPVNLPRNQFDDLSHAYGLAANYFLCENT